MSIRATQPVFRGDPKNVLGVCNLPLSYPLQEIVFEYLHGFRLSAAPKKKRKIQEHGLDQAHVEFDTNYADDVRKLAFLVQHFHKPLYLKESVLQKAQRHSRDPFSLDKHQLMMFVKFRGHEFLVTDLEMSDSEDWLGQRLLVAGHRKHVRDLANAITQVLSEMNMGSSNWERDIWVCAMYDAMQLCLEQTDLCDWRQD